MTDIKVVLKADTGNYVAKCNGSLPAGAYSDSVFVPVSEAELMNSLSVQFALFKLNNEKYALKAHTGNYVAKCNIFIPSGAYSDSVFVQVSEAELMNSLSVQFALFKLNNQK